MADAIASRLGPRFEARAVHVGERIDVRGIEPRLSPQLPVIVEVAPSGCAVLLRGGAVVVFGVDALAQERLLADLAPRIAQRHDKLEIERVQIRTGEADAIEPDALIVREVSLERLQIIGEILGKSVILGRHEQEIAEAFNSIEPMALQMKTAPSKLPWKQKDLVRLVGEAMLVEHQLVGRAELLEKPDLLWDNSELDRLYARLEDEYELRERHAALDTKLAVVSRAAQTMLELSQTRRSLNVEYYIVGLIIAELALAVLQLTR